MTWEAMVTWEATVEVATVEVVEVQVVRVRVGVQVVVEAVV